VVLRWQPSGAPDLVGYSILRRRSDQPEPHVLADSLQDAAYTDHDVAPQITYGYRVRAENRTGRWSATSPEVLIFVPADSDSSQTGRSVLTLTVGFLRSDPVDPRNRRVCIRWSAAADSGSAELAGFRIYRERLDEGATNSLTGREPLTPGLSMLPDSLRGPGVHRFNETLSVSGRYRYWIEALSAAGASSWLDPLWVTVPDLAPGLLEIWPNPTRGRLNIMYCLESAGTVEMSVYTADGRRIAAQRREEQGSGKSVWEISDLRRLTGAVLPAGVYYLRLELPDRLVGARIVVRQ
jgi:hypothetical protein